MNKAVVLAAVAVVLGPAATAVSTGFTLSERLFEGEWVAVRWNVTAPSDLRIIESSRTCHFGPSGTTMVGPSGMGIRDGKLIRPWAYAQYQWRPGDDNVDASAGAFHARGPQSSGSRGCSGFDGDTASYGRWLPERSVTAVVLGMGAQTFYNLTATWTYGVDSWDVVRGTGIAKTKAGFDDGAFVSVYPFVHANAGVGKHYGIDASNDLVGFFLPTYDPDGEDGSSIREWTCTKDGSPCEVEPLGGVTIASKGPAAWRFGIEKEVAVEWYYYALGAAELPDGSYLY